MPGKEDKQFDRRRIVLYVEDKLRSLTQPGKGLATAQQMVCEIFGLDSLEKMNSQRSIWKSWLPIAATLLVLGFAYSPLMSKFFRDLWNRSHYQHFPFVLAAFACEKRACAAQPEEV